MTAPRTTAASGRRPRTRTWRTSGTCACRSLTTTAASRWRPTWSTCSNASASSCPTPTTWKTPRGCSSTWAGRWRWRTCRSTSRAWTRATSRPSAANAPRSSTWWTRAAARCSSTTMRTSMRSTTITQSRRRARAPAAARRARPRARSWWCWVATDRRWFSTRAAASSRWRAAAKSLARAACGSCTGKSTAPRTRAMPYASTSGTVATARCWPPTWAPAWCRHCRPSRSSACASTATSTGTTRPRPWPPRAS
mmetsp:Transcript_5941/g.17889  ORF Transcript_5941/g.17889 Transcript_5941/m.17889 type:complete len:252 (-) Transcript_5941:125-880(-)